MDLSELEQVAAGHETQHLEFKRQMTSRTELARSIVCFANADGGRIVIGVDDDGTIIGVTDVDRLSQLVDDAAYEHCEPPVPVVIETVDGAEPPVVVVRVPRGPQRPYRTKQGLYYIRSGTRCRQASQEEIRGLFQAAGALSFDETILSATDVESDLDITAFREYVNAHAPAQVSDETHVPPNLVRSWKIADGDHLTVAGVLLFGKAPESHLPYGQISLARISGVEPSGEALDQITTEGTLFQQVHEAERFLRLHLRTPRRVEGFENEDQPELPLDALREVVVNAVVHRDYVIRAPIRVLVYDDRVEVRSPGPPPNTVSVESMLSGVHVVRNPHLYTRLYRAGLVSELGSGLPRARQRMHEVAGTELRVDVIEQETVVFLFRPRS